VTNHQLAPSRAPSRRRRSRSVALGALAALTAGAGAGALALATPAVADGGSYSSADALSVNDTDPTTQTSPITVSDVDPQLTASSVVLTLRGFSASPISDVDVTLTGSDGGTVGSAVCHPASGGPAADGSDATFNTNGTVTATCDDGSFGNLVGQTVDGTWVLTVSDDGNAGVTASITGWSLAFTAAPVITTQPGDVSGTSGDNANFTAAATAIPAPTVQWQKSTDNGDTFSDITGNATATSDTLTLSHVTTADNNSAYRAVYTSAGGSTQSFPAQLSVGANTPTVTTQPSNQSVLAGTDATFTAAASSDPASTVQWQSSTDSGKTFGDIPGATAGSYKVTAPTLETNGSQYRAVFTNDGGSATTNAATLTVTGRVLSAPGHFAAHQTGLGQVSVSWTASTDPGSPAITGYDAGWGTGQMGDGEGVPASSTSDVFNNLQPGSYTFSVAATNAAGSSVRVSLPLTVVAPSSTPTLGASTHRVISGTHVLLSGQAPASKKVTLQRKLPGGAFVSIATVTSTNYGHYAFAVPAMHTAYYRVRAASGAVSTVVKVVALDRMTLRATRTSARHYTLSGKVLPAVKGQLVKLYAAKNSGTYVLLAKVHVDKFGRWAFAHAFKATSYTFKAVASSTAYNLGNSTLLTVRVK
jgi:hypothetical protein